MATGFLAMIPDMHFCIVFFTIDFCKFCLAEFIRAGRFCWGMLKNYKTDITVIECDTEIGKVYQPRTLKQITTKVTGRGGTSYIPVIEYINAHKYRDAVMIYFTDGYGDSRIPKPKTYRNLWVVLRDKNNLSLSNPYGEVKTLMGDEDYKNRNI